MNYKLIKIDNLSGERASVYSVCLGDEGETLYERFLKENYNLYKSETININNRLMIIGSDAGARDIYFKPNEGNLGDGVEALYDYPEGNLRLYCIRYGTTIIILGGGGPKKVRALQEDTKLKKENYLLRKISGQITERIKDQRINFSEDYMAFEGELIFNEDSDE